MRILIRLITLMDPAYHVNADPDSSYHFDADPCESGSATLLVRRLLYSVPVLPAWAAEAGQSHLWGLPHAGFLTE